MDIKKESLKKKDKVNPPAGQVNLQAETKQSGLKQDQEKSRELAYKIAALLDDKKAQKIVIMDISEKSSIADYFVVCTGRSTTLIKALYEYVDEKLSKEGIEPRGRDLDAKWIAVDYLGVIVHIFYEETRDFYNLERLWDTGDNSKQFN